MGANWGHQLGLWLWPTPLPRCLHSGGCCERLDRTKHQGVTTTWLSRPRTEDGEEETARQLQRGFRGHGGHGGGWPVYFVPINTAAWPRSLAQHPRGTATTYPLPFPQVQERGARPSSKGSFPNQLWASPVVSGSTR